jgi:SEC-C motif domain protein
MLCPCCSGADYTKCCGPLHEGSEAANALILMRSRYSAYALQKAAYIIKTTHPKNKNFTLDFKKWEAQILLFCKTTQFTGLEIVDFQDGVSQASVSFIARLTQGERDASFKECSLFEKLDGRWLYKDGTTVGV